MEGFDPVRSISYRLNDFSIFHFSFYPKNQRARRSDRGGENEKRRGHRKNPVRG